VLDEAAPGEAVTVVGHSFGGGVAISLAQRHPARVGALVLVGSVGVPRALTASDHLLALPVVGDRLVRFGLASARQLLRALQAGIDVTERFADSALRELDGALHGALTARRHADAARLDIASRASHLTFVRALVDADAMPARNWESFAVEQRGLVGETPALAASLSELNVPVAVVAGARDRIVPLAAARELADRIPGAELVTVPRAGHLVPVDAPEILAGVIRRYAAAAAGGGAPA
jgi:pimeloyl-ACP methyl ester carboxylesterase